MNVTSAPPSLGSDGANPNIAINQLNTAATELVLEHGAMIMRDALEHSACAEDADDAYQRSLEILLTKAPSTDPAELVPWMRIVVKNEALDITRRRLRTAGEPIESVEDMAAGEDAMPDEVYVSKQLASAGAEALERLSADQVHCLLAYAHGHSYDEIAELTGFTARKVTRCVTTGRRAFASRFAAIESGSECERLEPVLQRMADGDSFAHVEARSHLRNCPACRATLRAYREAPSRISILFPLPLVAAVAVAPTDSFPGVLDHATALWSNSIDRINAQVAAFQHWLEVGTAKKLGVVAATIAALTAGGVAADHAGVIGDRPVTNVAQTAERPVRPIPPRLFDRIDSPSARARKRRKHSTRSAQSAPPPTHTPVATTTPKPAHSPKPVGDGSDEFLPESR